MQVSAINNQIIQKTPQFQRNSIVIPVGEDRNPKELSRVGFENIKAYHPNISFSGGLKLPLDDFEKILKESVADEHFAKIEANGDNFEKFEMIGSGISGVRDRITEWSGGDGVKDHPTLKSEIWDDMTHEFSNIYGHLGEKVIEGKVENLKEATIKMHSQLMDAAKRYQFFLDHDMASNDRPVSEAFDLAAEFVAPKVEAKGIKLKIKNEDLIRDPQDKKGVSKFTGKQKLRTQNDGYQNYMVFSNLLGNAVKYTEAGGTIDVGFRKCKDTGNIIFSVKDTGMGIPQGEVDKVLNGNRASNAVASKISGTGRGLYRVKRIIEHQKPRMSETNEFKVHIQSPAPKGTAEKPGTLIEVPLKLA